MAERDYIQFAKTDSVVKWVKQNTQKLLASTDCYTLGFARDGEVDKRKVGRVPLKETVGKQYDGRVLVIPLHYRFDDPATNSMRFISAEEYYKLPQEQVGRVRHTIEFDNSNHETCVCKVSWTGRLEDAKPFDIY